MTMWMTVKTILQKGSPDRAKHLLVHQLLIVQGGLYGLIL